jgi:hypothetical protein
MTQWPNFLKVSTSVKALGWVKDPMGLSTAQVRGPTGWSDSVVEWVSVSLSGSHMAKPELPVSASGSARELNSLLSPRYNQKRSIPKQKINQLRRS